VNNIDTTTPTLTLNGVDPVTVEVHGTYTDAGASCPSTDPCTITVNNPVNPDVIGTYTVTYTATDEAGNTATTTREVTIVDTTVPVIVITNTDPITLEV